MPKQKAKRRVKPGLARKPRWGFSLADAGIRLTKAAYAMQEMQRDAAHARRGKGGKRTGAGVVSGVSNGVSGLIGRGVTSLSPALFGVKIWYITGKSSTPWSCIMQGFFSSQQIAASAAQRGYGTAWRDLVEVTWRRMIA